MERAIDSVSNFQVLQSLQIRDAQVSLFDASFQFTYHQGMYSQVGKATQPILDSLVRSARRGNDTLLIVDEYTNLVTFGTFNYLDDARQRLARVIPWLSSEELNRRLAQRKKDQQSFAQLQAASRQPGQVVIFINEHGDKFHPLYPIKNCNHIKAVATDQGAMLMDTNISDEDYLRPASGIFIDQRDIAKELQQYFLLAEKGSYGNKKISCGKDSYLLFSDGKSKTGPIIEAALEKIAESRRFMLVATPFILSGPVAQKLDSVYRNGVGVNYITADQRKVKDRLLWGMGVKNLMMLKLNDFRVPIHYHPMWRHPKYMVFDNEWVLYTSDNFYAGSGSAEIGLLSRDKTLVKNLADFHDQAREEIGTYPISD